MPTSFELKWLKPKQDIVLTHDTGPKSKTTHRPRESLASPGPAARR